MLQSGSPSRRLVRSTRGVFETFPYSLLILQRSGVSGLLVLESNGLGLVSPSRGFSRELKSVVVPKQ
jgi:hypothetical protein